MSYFTKLVPGLVKKSSKVKKMSEVKIIHSCREKCCRKFRRMIDSKVDVIMTGSADLGPWDFGLVKHNNLVVRKSHVVKR